METKPLTTDGRAAPAVVPVDFKARRRPTLKHLGKGVYAYARPCSKCQALIEPGDRKCPACKSVVPDLVFWERPYVDGRQTTRKLKSTSLRHAQLEAGKNRSDQALSRINGTPDPYAQTGSTIAKILDGYEAAGCPKRGNIPRTGKQLADEKRNVAVLKNHLGKISWVRLGLEDLQDYHAARTSEIAQNGAKRGPGNRTVEIEERCLSAAFRWAVLNRRKTGVDRNPVAHDRPTRCRAEMIRHCRDVMPENAAELHRLARRLFEDQQSEVLGWQLLFEAMIGQRTSEILKLRRDAAAAFEPGFVQGKLLYLHRSKTSKGTFPYIEIHAALRDCLEAHQAWLKKRFPESPWWFPSHVAKGANPVRPDALTHALRRITPALGLPRRTSHGLRSYYVNVLRSQGKTDPEIALRIGHKSGGKLIVQVYGEILPYKLTWLPDDEDPAWSKWTAAGAKIEQMELGI